MCVFTIIYVGIAVCNLSARSKPRFRSAGIFVPTAHNSVHESIPVDTKLEWLSQGELF